MTDNAPAIPSYCDRSGLRKQRVLVRNPSSVPFTTTCPGTALLQGLD